MEQQVVTQGRRPYILDADPTSWNGTLLALHTCSNFVHMALMPRRARGKWTPSYITSLYNIRSNEVCRPRSRPWSVGPTGPDSAQTYDLARSGQYHQQESQLATSMNGVINRECPYCMVALQYNMSRQDLTLLFGSCAMFSAPTSVRSAAMRYSVVHSNGMLYHKLYGCPAFGPVVH